MSGNGRATAEITDAMWERMVDRVDVLEETGGKMLASAARSERLSQLTYDRLGPIEKTLGEIAAWKNTADGERVVSLTRKVTELEAEKHRIADEKRRDWLDLRRTIMGVVGAALVVEMLHRIGVLH